LSGETFFATSARVVYRLRPAPKDDAPPLEEGCATPFVYLYDVSSKNAKDFTFPSTRKALSTFAGAGEIGLVESTDGGRRLRSTVTRKAQGEAVIAHLKETMKDEEPQLYCYEPKAARKIELRAGEK